MNKPYKTDLGNKEIFIRNLKRYLAETGTRQNTIAQVVGVSTGTISDWMMGRTYPRMDKIQALADYFGIKKSDLIEDKKTPSANGLTEGEELLLTLFRQVPEDKQQYVLDMIRLALKTQQ